MADIFPEVGQVVLTSLLSLAAMFIFTRAGGKRQIAPPKQIVEQRCHSKNTPHLHLSL